ncbi:MAG: hypothetical protein JWM82_2807, partial [Myxococcales bacterium]|nr:hypothetical protein [Myxococcales bacterium]
MALAVSQSLTRGRRTCRLARAIRIPAP